MPDDVIAQQPTTFVVGHVLTTEPLAWVHAVRAALCWEDGRFE